MIRSGPRRAPLPRPSGLPTVARARPKMVGAVPATALRARRAPLPQPSGLSAVALASPEGAAGVTSTRQPDRR
eukprot:11155810-Lingulodinium_polyedra.AAC.1